MFGRLRIDCEWLFFHCRLKSVTGGILADSLQFLLRLRPEVWNGNMHCSDDCDNATSGVNRHCVSRSVAAPTFQSIMSSSAVLSNLQVKFTWGTPSASTCQTVITSTQSSSPFTSFPQGKPSSPTSMQVKYFSLPSYCRLTFAKGCTNSLALCLSFSRSFRTPSHSRSLSDFLTFGLAPGLRS